MGKDKIIIESGLSYGSVVDVVVIPEESKSTADSTRLHVIASFNEKACFLEKSSISSIAALTEACNALHSVLFHG